MAIGIIDGLTRRVAWIHADQAKAGRSIGVPLNNEVVVLLRALQGNHSKLVFTYKGKPVKKKGTQKRGVMHC